MSEPTQIADFPALEQAATCGCGLEFRQKGFMGPRGPFMMLPKKCAACREREEQGHRTAKQEREAMSAESQAARAAEEAEERRLAALEELAVPPLFAEATLETWALEGSPKDRDIQGRVLQLARRYLGRWPHVESVLCLRGGTGTGKGHWCYAVARELAGQHGARCRAVKCADMVRALRKSWGRSDAEGEDIVLDRFRRYDLLVIDEVSTHAFYGSNIHQHLYDVLDHRIEQLRPTILTSNDEDESLAAILRPALWSRLMGHSLVIDTGSYDFRVHRNGAREGT